MLSMAPYGPLEDSGNFLFRALIAMIGAAFANILCAIELLY